MTTSFSDPFFTTNLILSLVPRVLSLILAFEMPGEGEMKTQLVSDTVVAAIEALPDDTRAQIHADQVEPIIKTVTGLIVTYLNARGVFKKSEPAPVVTPNAPPPVIIDPPVDERKKLSDQLTTLREQAKGASGDALAAINRKIKNKTERLAALK